MSPDMQVPDPARRRFSRSAIVGSAVLLSLGNRAAWGTSNVVGCMSLATINSFDPTKNAFVSAPAGRPKHNEHLAAEIHRLADKPTYLGGSDGTYSTCREPNTLDGVCVVRGSCPARP
jgi:hypothetical protein